MSKTPITAPSPFMPPEPTPEPKLGSLVGKALDAIAFARMNVALRSPYLRAALYSMVPVPIEHFGWSPSWGTGTIGVTEHGVLIFDPHFVLKHAGLPLASVLRHECDHLVLRHAARRMDRDPVLWNQAADCVINPAIETEKTKDGQPRWQLPDLDYCTPSRLKLPADLNADQYYALMFQRGDLPTAGSNEDGSRGIDSPGTKTEDGSGGRRSNGLTNGRCGGVAGAPIDAAVESALDKKQGRSEAELRRMRRSVANEVRQIIEKKGRGTVPGEYAEWIDAMQTPSTVPWQTVFASLLRAAVGRVRFGDQDYSLRRPARRSFTSGAGVLRPGMISPDPEIAFCVDTSGSMSTSELAEVLREMREIFKATNIEEAWLLDVDTEVAAVRRVSIDKLARLQFHGRGGTSFRPAFDAVRKLPDPKPHLMIYLTDGQGDSVPKPTDMEVIWVLVGGNKHLPVDWGLRVHASAGTVEKGTGTGDDFDEDDT